jgi:multiple antibiotic resistance protein
MLESAGVALATFFATIGPLDVAAVFAALTAGETSQHKLLMAIRGTLVAAIILVIFARVGKMLLAGLGISLAALRSAGGILFLLIGIEMVFARSSGGISTTDEEEREATSKKDISVFPLATPLTSPPWHNGRRYFTYGERRGRCRWTDGLCCRLVSRLVFYFHNFANSRKNPTRAWSNWHASHYSGYGSTIVGSSGSVHL